MKTMKHLSGHDIASYCDGEVNHEDRFRIEKHLEECEKCESLFAEEKAFSGLLGKIIKMDFAENKKSDCLSDMEIAGYIENRISQKEKKSIEEHISRCEYCLDILANTSLTLYERKEESEFLLSYDKTLAVVRKRLRKEKANALMRKYIALLKESPFHVQKSLIKMKHVIKVMLEQSFTYPFPQFAPVFGECEANVLSPFGKIRYPVIFEWNPFKDANSYQIAVEGTDWSLRTAKTKLTIGPDKLKLNYDKEYMWELKILKDEDVIDEITGFFSFASVNEQKELAEIENQLTDIVPNEDQLMLLAGILETKEFYIEAIDQYKKAYAFGPLGGIAYRIAYCYEMLELENLRDEWNRKILKNELR